MERCHINLYSLILGLPDDVEDPDHYEILGLPRFTADVKAIHEAAIVQNSKLLRWQNSEHFKESLRLMQQIVEAKQVLEDPQTKQAYDRQLEAEDPTEDPEDLGTILDTLDLGTRETVETRLTPAPRPRDVNPVYTERRNRLRAKREAEKERQQAKEAEQQLTRTVLLVAGLLVMAFVLGILFYRISRPGPPSPQANTGGNEDSVSDSQSGPPELLKAPFDESEAKSAQTAWAKFLKTEVVKTNSIGMNMVLIPPGEFTMGSPANSAVIVWDEQEEHRVLLDQPFSMSRTEVTQAQWQKVMGTTPWHLELYVQEGPFFPASFVSWSDALAFCQKLTEQERDAGEISDEEEYTLPTEAQWEYACRAGSTTKYFFGDEESKLDTAAWHSQVSWSREERYAHRVGQRIPNAFGLNDTHGNVSEWCMDWYDADSYDSSLQENPTGPKFGTRRIHRGGGWSSTYSNCRSAARGKDAADTRNDDLGFRVVLRFTPNP